MDTYNQWIVWRRELRSDGRTDKVPVNAAGELINAHDRSGWMSRADAERVAALLGTYYGVGFVFTSNDPFFFIDVDDCYQDGPDGTEGSWAPIVHELCALLPGAAIEVSQSGRGIHIIGSGTVPEPRRCKAWDKSFDLYTDKRFCAIGHGFYSGDTRIDQSAGLAEIVRRWLWVDPGISAEQYWTAEPDPEWRGPTDDEELLRRAMRSHSAAGVFGGGVSFKQLWEADERALGERWPDDHQGRPYDASHADAALAQHLAFWTGKDCERIRSLMWGSALARDKWEREDYLPRTILGAVSRQRNVYQERERADAPISTQAETSGRTGYQFLSVADQIEYFKGCVYVTKLHRIHTPRGFLLKPEQFRAAYGGHVFAVDALNDRTTRNAWEAFTESQGHDFPKVDELRFNPREAPGQIGTDPHGISYYNSFYPLWGARSQSTVAPFLHHINMLLPNQSDREILLSYLAACVQLAGTKFQWCILLQGVPGNGKTLLWQVLEHAIGQRYCHQAQPRDLESVFNGWMEGRLLIGVEEIRVGARKDLADIVKPLITNRRIAIQPKGVDQYTTDNFANFLLFSNHKDAVYKAQDDRRYCVLYTAQQTPADLEQDGMGPEYFDRLFDWLEAGGIEAVAEYLWTRPISVRVLGRAPETTATPDALAASLGPAEQLVLEAVEAGEPGFGPLLCTVTVRQYLEAHGKRLAPRSVISTLERLGYVPHPALVSQGGRTEINGIKRRLFVKPDSPWVEITDVQQLASEFR